MALISIAPLAPACKKKSYSESLSHSVVSDSATPWIVARQAPLSVGFSRQEYWSGLPFPPAGDLPDPGIVPKSLASPALAGRFFTTSAIGEPVLVCCGLHSKVQRTGWLKHQNFIFLRFLQVRSPRPRFSKVGFFSGA